MNIDALLGRQISVKISDVIIENHTDMTFLFEYDKSKKSPHPGQFFMVWVPSVDEIPMSFSYHTNNALGITVRPVGETTKALASKVTGDWIGIRGPFGTGFRLNASRPLVVGGGIGMAPLRPLVYTLLNTCTEVILVIAARTRTELLFVNEFRTADENIRITITTNDGTAGIKGLATDVVEQIISQESPDMIYTCGPEMMMFHLFKLAQDYDIKLQASLERFMKCGCGICGSCALDYTGHLVCLDGPVFTTEQLSEIFEFGRYSRDAMGLKLPFNKYSGHKNC